MWNFHSDFFIQDHCAWYIYYEQGSFSLVCFHGWLNYPVRNNHLYSFYTRLKLQWIVDHIISYIWLLSICGSQKTQLDSFFSHQSNIYIQSKSSAIIYRSEFLKNSNIKGCFFSENSMGLKKICQNTILNLNFWNYILFYEEPAVGQLWHLAKGGNWHVVKNVPKFKRQV